MPGAEKSNKVPAKGRKRAADTSGTKWKRIRGLKENRTCPKCKRVFTSVLGRDYHVCEFSLFKWFGSFKRIQDPSDDILWYSDLAKRVCEQKSGCKGAADETPFVTLDPGSLFVTDFGVVRVVDDSQAVPTGKLAKDALQRGKLWKSQKNRQEVKRRENYGNVTVHSLVRRK